MALGPNTNLDTTATVIDVENDGVNGIIDLSGNALADAVWFNNEGTGQAGDETIEGFGLNDSILNWKKIFDGNNDGIISFGANGTLAIDRTSSTNAGADQITITGFPQGALRYLGTKGGDSSTVDGAHVYAAASVRLAGFTEGTVGNDSFDALSGDRTYFYDTALGLNLGADTIRGFGAGDRIATTTKIHNGPDAGATITFGQNGVLDLPGEQDATAGYTGQSAGGQIEFVGGPDQLVLLGSQSTGGVTYYYYGIA